jgi:phosphoribosylformylglycinamidine (FGAM) synthase-like enzyme
MKKQRFVLTIATGQIEAFKNACSVNNIQFVQIGSSTLKELTDFAVYTDSAETLFSLGQSYQTFKLSNKLKPTL